MPYQPAWDLQCRLFDDTVRIKVENRNRQDQGLPPLPTPNYLLLVEHPHVYTLGKSGKSQHLLISDDQLAAIGATYVPTSRGGDITYHGYGQIVGYPILDLDHFFTDIHRYLRYLEEAVIRTLAHYGLDGGRIAGLTGVWLDHAGGPSPRKICAIGVKTSRWVTMHGFALNINTDLSYFGHIVPCGITDKAVTSLALELGRAVPAPEVEALLRRELAAIFGWEEVPMSPDLAAAIGL